MPPQMLFQDGIVYGAFNKGYWYYFFKFDLQDTSTTI